MFSNVVVYLIWATRRLPETEFENKSHCTHEKAPQEAPKGPRLGHAVPNKGHDEDGGDGRRQIGRDGLDVQEQLRVLKAQNDRNPQDTDGHQ